MISYNSQVGEGKYYIQVETDNHEAYLAIQQVIRSFIDFANSQYDEYDYMVEELPTYEELEKENKVYMPGEMIISKDLFLKGQDFLKIGDGKTKFCDIPFAHNFGGGYKHTKKELANILRTYSSKSLRDLRKKYAHILGNKE